MGATVLSPADTAHEPDATPVFRGPPSLVREQKITTNYSLSESAWVHAIREPYRKLEKVKGGSLRNLLLN